MNLNMKRIVPSLYFLFFICVFSINIFCPESSEFYEGADHVIDLLTEFCDDNFADDKFKSKENIDSLAKAVYKSAIENGFITNLIGDLESYVELKQAYPDGALEYISKVQQLDAVQFRNQSYSINSVYDLTPLENKICSIEKIISNCCLKISENLNKNEAEQNNLESGISAEAAKQLAEDLKNIQSDLEEYKKEIEANSNLATDDIDAIRGNAKIKRLGSLIISNSLKICGNLVVGGKFCVGGVDIVALLKIYMSIIYSILVYCIIFFKKEN